MEIIRFGIIGTGNITKRFIKGVDKVTQAQVTAVLSRSIEKAQSYAQAYEGMHAFSDLESFLASKIDAVYIATPNHLHKEYIMKALAAGKHVICEKPMVLNEADVHECFAFAKTQQRLLMEAMKPCFLPTTKQACKWIQEGRIGEVRYLEAGYCSSDASPFLTGWHSERVRGGGALYDIGVYPLAFVNHIITSNILHAQSLKRNLESEVDGMSIIQLQYENDILAQIKCAVDTPMQNVARIYGTKGYIEIENYWKSEQANLYSNGKTEVFHEPHDASEFQYQIRDFIKAIQNGDCQQSVMNEEASARNARVIDQIQEGY